MSRLAYLAVLMVALGSVLFGLDWQSAPMSPMPETRLALQAASAYAPPPMSRTVPDGPNVGLSTASPANSGAAANARGATTSKKVSVQTNAKQPDSSNAANTSPSAAADNAKASLAQVAAEGTQLKCNARACASAYQSFQASDCTYQPNNGPRRLCKK